MDTLTKSCSPTIVITANGEVQTHEEATVYVKELDMFLTMKVLENTPAVLSLRKLCGENGYSYERSMVKNHISLKTVSGSLQNGKLRSNCGSRLVKFVFWIFINFKDTFKTGESLLNVFFKLVFFTYGSDTKTREREDQIESDISPVTVSTTVDERSGRPDETTIDQGNPLNSEIPEWLQEFRENLVDDRVPEHRD